MHSHTRRENQLPQDGVFLKDNYAVRKDNFFLVRKQWYGIWMVLRLLIHICCTKYIMRLIIENRSSIECTGTDLMTN